MNLQIETFVIGPFPNNSYLLIDETSKEMVVVDPSIESEPVIARVRELTEENFTLKAIWNTHGHLDHVYDNGLWKETFNVPVSMHEADVFLLEHLREQAIWLGLSPENPVTPDKYFQDGEVLSLGAHRAEVIHVPGHSPGSVAFYFAQQSTLISGDVLFQGSVGRTDLPGSDGTQLQNSLKKLADLLPETRILTGHGEETTLARELESNPFLDFLRHSA